MADKYVIVRQQTDDGPALFRLCPLVDGVADLSREVCRGNDSREIRRIQGYYNSTDADPPSDRLGFLR